MKKSVNWKDSHNQNRNSKVDSDKNVKSSSIPSAASNNSQQQMINVLLTNFVYGHGFANLGFDPPFVVEK